MPDSLPTKVLVPTTAWAPLMRVAATTVLVAGVALVAAQRKFERVTPARTDTAVAQAQTNRKLDDESGKALDAIKAFQRRAWNVVRDEKIRSATIVVSVTCDGKTGRYRAAFDATRPFLKQVTMDMVSEDEGLDPTARPRAKRVANVAFYGGSEAVLWPLPPLALMLSRDRGGRTVVTAPAFRRSPQVSYNFNEQGVATWRGEIYDESIVRTEFKWQDVGTGAVLVSSNQNNGAVVTRYEFDPRTRGFPVLNAVIQVEKDGAAGTEPKRYDAKIEWERIDK